jgi:hypothetical protein
MAGGLIVQAAANAQRAVDSILGIAFENAERSEEHIKCHRSQQRPQPEELAA